MLNVSAGYSVTNLAMPSSGRVALVGAHVSISADSGTRFGATLDLDYGRAANVFSSGRRMDALSYLAGPVFCATSGNLVSTYLHLLVGGAKVTGPVPSGIGGLSAAYVHYPAWAVGGGAEYRLSSSFAFRVSVDYLHMHFFKSATAIKGQNDIRVVNSLVYYLGVPHVKYRR
ncbi:MAG TPA: hypothetical protein VH110_10155 [Candidatus Acidoferrum sp.]|jgi:hypothetical protein|nr:hypothetical protein [Candidatus Acidoferrum sp.]